MPRTANQPAYRRYKPKDLAIVRLNGKDIYLGEYENVSPRVARCLICRNNLPYVGATTTSLNKLAEFQKLNFLRR